MQDPFEPVSYASEGPQGPTFCVNMSRIIDQLKLKELEAVARDRCAAGGLCSMWAALHRWCALHH